MSIDTIITRTYERNSLGLVREGGREVGVDAAVAQSFVASSFQLPGDFVRSFLVTSAFFQLLPASSP